MHRTASAPGPTRAPRSCPASRAAGGCPERHHQPRERRFSGGSGKQLQRDPPISADGRCVAFFSGASNLVPGDTNGTSDILAHDRQTGQTARVSVDSAGKQGNGWSLYPSISADGRYVAFQSLATDLLHRENPLLGLRAGDRIRRHSERLSAGRVHGLRDPSRAQQAGCVLLRRDRSQRAPVPGRLVVREPADPAHAAARLRHERIAAMHWRPCVGPQRLRHLRLDRGGLPRMDAGVVSGSREFHRDRVDGRARVDGLSLNRSSPHPLRRDPPRRTFRIYKDFSGRSDIAIGPAGMLDLSSTSSSEGLGRRAMIRVGSCRWASRPARSPRRRTG